MQKGIIYFNNVTIFYKTKKTKYDMIAKNLDVAFFIKKHNAKQKKSFEESNEQGKKNRSL